MALNEEKEMAELFKQTQQEILDKLFVSGAGYQSPWYINPGDSRLPKEFSREQIENIVHVRRRGPDSENWLLTEANHVDWEHDGLIATRLPLGFCWIKNMNEKLENQDSPIELSADRLRNYPWT